VCFFQLCCNKIHQIKSSDPTADILSLYSRWCCILTSLLCHFIASRTSCCFVVVIASLWCMLVVLLRPWHTFFQSLIKQDSLSVHKNLFHRGGVTGRRWITMQILPRWNKIWEVINETSVLCRSIECVPVSHTHYAVPVALLLLNFPALWNLRKGLLLVGVHLEANVCQAIICFDHSLLLYQRWLL
jgi:hypothetical protein